jgi:hypothetical protein
VRLSLRSLGEASAVALATGLALRLAHGIDTVRDLPIDDEAGYAASGMALRAALRTGMPAQWPSADWGPLYSCWYALVNVFCPDRVRLVDVSWTALVVGNTLGFYALARRLSQPPPIALFIAAAPLLGSFYHFLPFPSLLYLLLLLASALLALACKSRIERWFVLLGGMAFAAFVRPEASTGFLAGAAVLLVGAVLERARLRALLRGVRPIVPAVVLVSAVVLVASFGNPLGGARGFDAFSQHYAFDVSQHERLSVNPWVSYRAVAQRDFGPSDSLWTAARFNPRAFAGHALYNVRALPGNVLDLCALRRSLTSGPAVPWLAASAVLLSAMAIAIAWCVARARRAEPAQRSVLELFALVVISAAPGIVLIYPRAHHLVAVCGIGWVLGASFVADRVRHHLHPKTRAKWLSTLAVAAGLWLLLPTSSASEAAQMPMRRAVAALRAARLQPVAALQLGAGFMQLAGYDAPIVDGWVKSEPLSLLVQRNAVGTIILGESLLMREAFAGDPDVQAFLHDPRAHGFCEIYRDPAYVRIFAAPAVVGDEDLRRACVDGTR